MAEQDQAVSGKAGQDSARQMAEPREPASALCVSPVTSTVAECPEPFTCGWCFGFLLPAVKRFFSHDQEACRGWTKAQFSSFPLALSSLELVWKCHLPRQSSGRRASDLYHLSPSLRSPPPPPHLVSACQSTDRQMTLSRDVVGAAINLMTPHPHPPSTPPAPTPLHDRPGMGGAGEGAPGRLAGGLRKQRVPPPTLELSAPNSASQKAIRAHLERTWLLVRPQSSQ